MEINGKYFKHCVEQNSNLDPLSDMTFVLHDCHCDKVKLLFWDGSCVCMMYKRIEQGLSFSYQFCRRQETLFLTKT